MVIFIVILLLILGVALVGALYSSFLVFYLGFGDTIEYNKAYYAAISSLERAELVLRYRSPGYEGSGGRLGPDEIGDRVDASSGSFSLGPAENGVLWEISSRTKSIPASGEGNVEWMLMTGDSADYNMLDYVNAENFTFMLDPSGGYPYTGVALTKSNVHSFSGNIRLPSLLKGHYNFGDLDTTQSLGNERVKDDVVVDWSFRGTYNGNSFQVFGTPSVKYSENAVDEDRDTLFRESKINNVGGKFSPIAFAGSQSPFSTSDPGSLTVISMDEDRLKGETFFGLLFDDKTKDVIFRIALLNLLRSEHKNIYPYLEYRFSFFTDVNRTNPAWISDRFYTITATGKYGNYEVKLLLKKPTIKESILGAFTIIF